jgi:hypothetical protein
LVDVGTKVLNWGDSSIRMNMSKIESISAHAVTHYTLGRIAQSATLQLTYGGSMSAAKWLSLVDSTLNSNYPCADTAVAASQSSSLHSGPVQAGSGTNVVQVDTASLSRTKTFAACYVTTGTADYTGWTSDWSDSGIRLSVSGVTHLLYGTPVRTMTSSNTAIATNTLPQVQNVKLTYAGDLNNNKYLSIVDAAINA